MGFSKEIADGKKGIRIKLFKSMPDDLNIKSTLAMVTWTIKASQLMLMTKQFKSKTYFIEYKYSHPEKIKKHGEAIKTDSLLCKEVLRLRHT